jgi:hypothetical protein
MAHHPARRDPRKALHGNTLSTIEAVAALARREGKATISSMSFTPPPTNCAFMPGWRICFATPAAWGLKCGDEGWGVYAVSTNQAPSHSRGFAMSSWAAMISSS